MYADGLSNTVLFLDALNRSNAVGLLDEEFVLETNLDVFPVPAVGKLRLASKELTNGILKIIVSN